MNRTWLLGGMVALALSLLPTARAQEEAGGKAEGGKQEGRRGMDRRRDMRKKIQQRREKMRERVAKNLPGAEEEFERHEAAMQAIHEKIRGLAEQMKPELKDAKDADAREQVAAKHGEQLKALAGEIVDERLLHRENMLGLEKANRDAAVERLAGMLSKAGRRRGNAGPGKGDRMRGSEGQRRRAPESPTEGEAPSPAGQAPDLNDQDLARALAEALE